ncbi:hypothetical protein BURK2_02150 [Burkholderiales bacterium]|nr:MAG: hypothetical protein F9K47_16070 [Burkholderiales bacterium]CAG0986695.1 hypothetical protein BURK2_02150 [Burkholderiales bacterium]
MSFPIYGLRFIATLPPPPGAPNFKDRSAAAIHALGEPDRLKARVLELAAKDEEFRREIFEGLKQIGKGRRGAIRFEAELLSMATEWVLKDLKENPRSWLGKHRAKHGTPKGAEPWIPAKRELATKAAELLDAPSSDAVRKRLQRAKRAP